MWGDPRSPIEIIFDRPGAMTESQHARLMFALDLAVERLRLRPGRDWTQIEVSFERDSVRARYGTIHSNGEYEVAIAHHEYRWNEDDGVGYSTWIHSA